MTEATNQYQTKNYYHFSDDRMFCTVMSENPELLRKTLELLLDTKIRKIVKHIFPEDIQLPQRCHECPL